MSNEKQDVSVISTPSTTSRRTLEGLIAEEIPIQRASIEMSGGMPRCMTLFDNFLLCYSLPSQTISLYRNGGIKDCGLKFADFKFCMSIKNLSDERKEEIWIKRRAEWWANRRMGKSSEDVWTARKNVYVDTKVKANTV